MRTATIERRITELALSFPEAYEDRPWGDFPVFKVGQNKVFGLVVARVLAGAGRVVPQTQSPARPRDPSRSVPG